MRVHRIHGGGGGRGAALVTTIEQQDLSVARGEYSAPELEIGTSIGAYHAMACAAGRGGALRELYGSIRGKRSAMKLDLNPFDGDGIGYDLDQMDELAARAGIGSGMRVPTYVGVVDLLDWHAPTGPFDLPGHRLVRVDQLPPAEALLWAKRSACQRPFHQWEGTRDDGPQWVDGGFAAPNPPLPSGDVRADSLPDLLLVNACSPMTAPDRREARGMDDVRGAAQVALLVVDQVIDRNVMLDLARLEEYARQGVRVEARWPRSLAAVGRTFDLRPKTTEARLGPVGEATWRNVHRFGPWPG